MTEPRSAVVPDSSSSWEDRALRLIDYYRRLVDGDNGDRWKLGLFMAHYWLSLLQQTEYRAEPVRVFLQALEAERMNQGSGWVDLWLNVRNWADDSDRTSRTT